MIKKKPEIFREYYVDGGYLIVSLYFDVKEFFDYYVDSEEETPKLEFIKNIIIKDIRNYQNSNCDFFRIKVITKNNKYPRSIEKLLNYCWNLAQIHISYHSRPWKDNSINKETIIPNLEDIKQIFRVLYDYWTTTLPTPIEKDSVDKWLALTELEEELKKIKE